MSTQPSPWTAKAKELLAGGEWYDQEQLLNELIKLVPPGKALRRNETERARMTKAPTVRSRVRSTDYLVASGARRLVRDSLFGTNGARTFERGVLNGRPAVRLREQQ